MRNTKVIIMFWSIVLFSCQNNTEMEILQDTEPPSAPTGLSASNLGQTAVDLSWDASTDNVGVTGYSVYRDGTGIGDPTGTSYSVSDLTADTTYSFTVTSRDAAGNESVASGALEVTTTDVPSSGDTEPPSAPTGLSASNLGQTTVDLSWDASTDNVGVTDYSVYRDGTGIGDPTGTSYSVSGLTADTTYSFTVTSRDAAGNESVASGALEVTTTDVSSSGDKVLIFTKTTGFRHGSISNGVSAITSLGSSNNFEITQTENSGDFTLANLQQYQLVIFLSTTGDVLNSSQEDAFESYIRSGGSFMGVHAATDTEYDWPWYGQLVGAYFNGHPSVQEASMDVLTTDHPSTSHLGSSWTRTDEWYNFRDINGNIIPVLNLDESSYTGGNMGDDHPIAWYHEFDGGRSFYTAGGHTIASFNEPDFQKHLLGGILYCLGR